MGIVDGRVAIVTGDERWDPADLLAELRTLEG